MPHVNTIAKLMWSTSSKWIFHQMERDGVSHWYSDQWENIRHVNTYSDHFFLVGVNIFFLHMLASHGGNISGDAAKVCICVRSWVRKRRHGQKESLALKLFYSSECTVQVIVRQQITLKPLNTQEDLMLQWRLSIANFYAITNHANIHAIAINANDVYQSGCRGNGFHPVINHTPILYLSRTDWSGALNCACFQCWQEHYPVPHKAVFSHFSQIYGRALDTDECCLTEN